MPEPRHIPKCEVNTADAAAQAAVYRKLWPEHCTTCFGWGLVPAKHLGAGAQEECPLCMQSGWCPRCGAQGLGPEAKPTCHQCLWMPGTPGVPYAPPCICKEAPRD